jgi:hypothetical protein
MLTIVVTLCVEGHITKYTKGFTCTVLLNTYTAWCVVCMVIFPISLMWKLRLIQADNFPGKMFMYLEPGSTGHQRWWSLPVGGAAPHYAILRVDLSDFFFFIVLLGGGT